MNKIINAISLRIKLLYNSIREGKLYTWSQYSAEVK
ncbi:unknown [Bacteroides sp. CAG:709]|nr:unknown [Bacteroides sp. CAG:709]